MNALMKVIVGGVIGYAATKAIKRQVMAKRRVVAHDEPSANNGRKPHDPSADVLIETRRISFENLPESVKRAEREKRVMMLDH